MIVFIEYQYFPPVTLFSYLKGFSHCIFFEYDEFRKMSFRNRCVIAGANGPINLTVPVRGGRNQRILSKEVEIDNRIAWQLNHWKSICSCYNHSPWFEHYKHSLLEIFETRYEKLIDLNLAAFRWTIAQLNISTTWETGSVPVDKAFEDLRNRLMPKLLTALPTNVEYRQVFQEQIGFLPHLSILDLLFCTGMKAHSILEFGV